MSSTQQLLLGEGAVNVIPNYIEEVFSTFLYTGNGSTQTITNNIDLSTNGGMVWTKSRSNAQFNWVFDTVRGANSPLTTNSNGNVSDLYTDYFSPATNIILGTTTGYSIGTGTGGLNTNTYTYVGWTFREKPKFFDIVTYTGTGSVRTIAHNLGSTPGSIIVKDLDAGGYNWQVYHRSLTSAAYSIQLNQTAAQSSQSTIWDSTAPTSSVFTVGTSSAVNQSGKTYVAYLFAHDAGGFGLTGTDNVISCGSFVFTSPGPTTVNLGYEPQWILYKNANDVDGWNLFDNMRGFSMTQDALLVPNTSAAENTYAGYDIIDPTATGFTIKDGVFGSTYIYIAIRRGPMKVPTVGTSVYDAISRTGTGATATVTGLNFPPDLLFVAANTSNGYGNVAWDRLRGISPYLGTANPNTEANSGNSILSYNMNGMTVGTDTSSFQVNQSGVAYINWFFRRAPSFFDEVCYTGTGSNTTFTHNLTVVPELIIVKRRDATGAWDSYSSALANTEYVVLNTTAAKATGATRWNSTTPTSSVFSVGTSTTTNASAGTYVAYLFATCAGVSKVGTYTGNGSTQTINCGFGAGGARFVLIKRTDSTGNWYVYDIVRGMTVLTDPYYLLNSTAAQVATLGSVTTVSTGFALNSAITAAINESGGTYIFLAIA